MTVSAWTSSAFRPKQASRSHIAQVVNTLKRALIICISVQACLFVFGLWECRHLELCHMARGCVRCKVPVRYRQCWVGEGLRKPSDSADQAWPRAQRRLQPPSAVSVLCIFRHVHLSMRRALLQLGKVPTLKAAMAGDGRCMS